MSVPRYPGKWNSPSVCQPQDLLNYLYKENKSTWPGFETCLLLYPHAGLQKLKAAETFCQGQWLGLKFHWLKNQKVALVTGLGYGAPALAMKVEELIALGVKRFVLLGTAGGLQNDLQPGAVILCAAALRDEGVSAHYLSSEPDLVKPSHRLTSELSMLLKASDQRLWLQGATWTTDAVYRETREEIEQYRSQGILCVEMEAAALFAVAQFRQVEASALFVISDLIQNQGWQPYFRDGRVKDSLFWLLNRVYRHLQDQEA